MLYCDVRPDVHRRCLHAHDTHRPLIKPRIKVQLYYGVIFMLCDVLLVQTHARYKKFNWWNKTRLRKGIPYLDMARYIFFSVWRLSSLKGECCANDDGLWIIHLKVPEEGKSRFVLLFCAILEQRIGFTQQIKV